MIAVARENPWTISVTLYLLLTVVTSASADCAWVVWEESYKVQEHSWKRASAWGSHDECFAVLHSTAEGYARGTRESAPDTRVTVDHSVVKTVSPSGAVERVIFQWWPETHRR